MNRTVIYARVSTEDQVEKYGIPSQLRACRGLASTAGLEVIDEIVDEDVSGALIDRPGLDRVRRMARERQIDIVLMLDVDRLSRELAHLLILKPEIERHCRLEFVAAKFEDSPSGRMFFGIRGVISQYERELTRERTMRGKRERALSGLMGGGRIPYGYICDAGRLAEDPERSATVRRIFTAYESGISLRGIASTLREDGVATWSGRPWGKTSIRRILTNETYAGIAHYGTHRREGTLLRLRPPADRVVLHVPALVDHGQWDRVQHRLSLNPMVGRPSTSFLLRGILHCAACGRKMYAGNGTRNQSYRCSGRDPLISGQRCRQRASSHELDTAAWAVITRTFADVATLNEVIRAAEHELRAPEVSSEDLRRRVAKLKRKEDTALGAMLDPDLAGARATIKAEYRAAADERRKLEAVLASQERSQQRSPGSGWVEEAVRTIRDFVAQLTDRETRQKFVRKLVSRAEWDGEYVQMVCFVDAKLVTTSWRSDQFKGIQIVLRERVAA